jgi:hypothetical protein
MSKNKSDNDAGWMSEFLELDDEQHPPTFNQEDENQSQWLSPRLRYRVCNIPFG